MKSKIKSKLYRTGIKELPELTVYEMPRRRAVAVVKACVVHERLFFIDKDKQLYSKFVSKQCGVCQGLPSNTEIQAMRLLGCITPKQAQMLVAKSKERDALLERRYAAMNFTSAARTLGLTLTQRQLKQIGK